MYSASVAREFGKTSNNSRCVICFSTFKFNFSKIFNDPQNIYGICNKYLHSDIIKAVHEGINLNDMLICDKCIKSAVEIVDVAEKIEVFQKILSEQVVMFSLEVLQRRGENAMNEVGDMAGVDNSAKKLATFDVTGIPSLKNNYFTPEPVFSDMKSPSPVQSNLLKMADSDVVGQNIPLCTPANATNLITFEKIKTEKCDAIIVEGNSSPPIDMSVVTESTSNGKEGRMNNGGQAQLKNAPTRQTRPIIKLKRMTAIIKKTGDGKTSTVNRNSNEVQTSLISRAELTMKSVIKNEDNTEMLVNFGSAGSPNLAVKETCIDNSPIICSKDDGDAGSNYASLMKNPGQIIEVPCFSDSFDIPKRGCRNQGQGEKFKKQKLSVGATSQCSVYKNAFTSKTLVHSHIQVAHKQKQDSFQCYICHKKFQREDKNNFALHIKTHMEGKSFECKLCQKNYFSKLEITLHCEKQHPLEYNSKSKFHTYILTRWGSSGNDQQPKENALYGNRKGNVKSVHSSLKGKQFLEGPTSELEKNFQCSLCTSSFDGKCKLYSHMLTHEDFKPFQCDKCNFRTKTKSGITSHMKYKHTKTRNFQCKECGKDFKTAFCVKQHYKNVHSGFRSYHSEVVIKKM